MIALTNLYLITQRAERALPIATALVEKTDNESVDNTVWQLHGKCLATLGRYDDAIESYSVALKGQPHSAEVLVNLAQLELLVGNPQQAQIHAQNAIALNPQYQPGLEVLHKVRLVLNRQTPTTLR